MQINSRRFVKILPALFVSILLTAFNNNPENNAHSQRLPSPDCVDPNAYLELSVIPSTALTGNLVTLNIIYHRIGLPYTYVGAEPPGLVELEPPIEMPCTYGEHINACTSITFRTISAGVVQIHAGATGELWGEDCQCWCWGSAQDNGPATLIIVATTSKMYLPSVFR